MTPGGAPDVERRLATWLEAEIEPLAPVLVQAMLQAEPEWLSGAAQTSHAVEDVRGTLGGLVDALNCGGSVSDTAFRGAVRLAVAAAERDVPWATVAHAWSSCRRELLDRSLAWLTSEEWTDPAAAAAGMRSVVLALAVFGDELEGAMAAAHRETASRVLRRGDHRQSEHIDDLLAGRAVQHAELSFELRSDHLALVAWGPGRTDAIGQLAMALGADVTIEPRRDRDWAWLHGRPELRRDHPDVVRGFEPPPGTFLALGNRGSGRPGFAVSHRQARLAERVATQSGAAVTVFGDVALEAFALADEGLARGFVERELGMLAEDKPRTAALRDTLEAYFAAGNRATAAAETLQVHERTVSYRIRTAEERLGCYLNDCQDELALALRLRRLFDPCESRDAPGRPA